MILKSTKLLRKELNQLRKLWVLPELKESVIEAEQAKDMFDCVLCDFTSIWKNGLKIHVAKKHTKIKQLDGNTTEDSDSDDTSHDDKYEGTKHYWESGRLGRVYQVFLEATELIETSDLTEDQKEEEKTKVLEARKSAFGPQFTLFLPLSLRS